MASAVADSARNEEGRWTTAIDHVPDVLPTATSPSWTRRCLAFSAAPWAAVANRRRLPLTILLDQILNRSRVPYFAFASALLPVSMRVDMDFNTAVQRSGDVDLHRSFVDVV